VENSITTYEIQNGLVTYCPKIVHKFKTSIKDLIRYLDMSSH